MKNIAIMGSGGAIGAAVLKQLSAKYPGATIHAFSRSAPHQTQANIVNHDIEYGSEEAIEQASLLATKDLPLDLVFVATGILHEGEMMPEKSLKDLSAQKFQRLFEINTILPAMVAKHFVPKLNKQDRSVFAALSARVGSISDNQLGGWYSYRASKAALNMILKNAAIEIARRNKQAIVVGLHPGTVRSNLSQPFQSNVPDAKLFDPDYAAEKLITVIEGLTPDQSGKCFAWDGQEIEP